MKKIISLILALMLVLCMGVAAFAEEGTTWDGTYAPTDERTFNEIVKTYESENSVVVNETLSFTSAAATTNPDGGTANLTVADLVVSSTTPGTLAVTIPSLSKAGIYEWTITETAGNTAGVTYSQDEVHVIVYVVYDNENHALKIADVNSYIKKAEDGTKAKTFTNTFKSGSFTVAKDVTGNMANVNDEFEITVTLTSTNPIGTNISVAGTTVTPADWSTSAPYTYTFTTNYSKIGGAKTFSDIPVDVSVSVSENSSDDNMKGYTYVSTKVGTTDFTGMTIADDTASDIVVTNDKGTEIDMGISTDSLPYVMLLGIVTMIGAAMLIKRRATNN